MIHVPDSLFPIASPTRENLLSITERGEWKEKAQEFLKQSSFDKNFIEEFHTHWVEVGHKIRAQIDDDQILVNLLTRILPKYQGPAITLYRGENLKRRDAAQIGPCWTSSIETAKMFARGLNAIESGGVLLEINCPSEAIISGPSRHSNSLRESEYTVNCFRLPPIKVLENFPAITIIN